MPYCLPDKYGIGDDMEKHQSGRTSSVKKGRKAKTHFKGQRAAGSVGVGWDLMPLFGKRAVKHGRRGAKGVPGAIGPHTGLIAPTALADAFGVSVAALARTVGLSPETLQRTARVEARKTQERLRETTEIIRRVRDWAGGDVQAMAWYRAEPIPAFGGRTAESLVKEGKADAVRDYLDAVANGSFA
jgi:Protein of unknown function (DUF2384)